MKNDQDARDRGDAQDRGNAQYQGPDVAWTHETRTEFRRRRRGRNWALGAILVAFAVLVYFVALIRMGGS